MKIKSKEIKNNTVHISATLTQAEVDTQKEHAVDALISTVTIKGFRQGKAPKSIAKDSIDPDKLSNHILSHVLNDIIDQVVKENKYRLLGRPVLENIDSKEDTGWEIKITMPLYPKVDVKNYKKLFSKIKKSKTNSKISDEQKIDQIYENLLKGIKIDVPVSVIDEETNYSLERLAEQAKTLNLTLEKYLKAANKTIEEVKTEYAKKAEESIKLDLILLEIAREEKIDTELDEIKQMAQVGNIPENQYGRLKSIIDRRKTIDLLLKLC
jgi:FKBP-type peptidyl-prolyl cis-trans isomerase (trigger factor)